MKLAAEDPPQFINLSFETERNPNYLVAGEILARLFFVEIAKITHRRDWLFCLLDVVGIESPNCFETAFGGHHIYLFILLQGCIEEASLLSQPALQDDREMKPASVYLSFLPGPLPYLHLVHRCHNQDLGQRELADRLGHDLEHTGDLAIHNQGSAICVPTQLRIKQLSPLALPACWWGGHLLRYGQCLNTGNHGS